MLALSTKFWFAKFTSIYWCLTPVIPASDTHVVPPREEIEKVGLNWEPILRRELHRRNMLWPSCTETWIKIWRGKAKT